MGTSLYFDFRTFITLNVPIDSNEILGLTRIHTWIALAFGGLWVTGIALIYIRTAFDISSFSPKLWLKIGVMVFMVWNAREIGKKIIPLLNNNVGAALIDLPASQLVSATQLGINSMFCWTVGLVLGSSLAVKTATWEFLLPAAIVWFVTLTLVGQATILVIRLRKSGYFKRESALHAQPSDRT